MAEKARVSLKLCGREGSVGMEKETNLREFWILEIGPDAFL